MEGLLAFVDLLAILEIEAGCSVRFWDEFWKFYGDGEPFERK